MLDEISVFQNSGTLELVPLPYEKFVVGCRWISAIKVGPDGTIDHFKACFVTKSYKKKLVWTMMILSL